MCSAKRASEITWTFVFHEARLKFCNLSTVPSAQFQRRFKSVSTNVCLSVNDWFNPNIGYSKRRVEPWGAYTVLLSQPIYDSVFRVAVNCNWRPLALILTSFDAQKLAFFKAES